MNNTVVITGEFKRFIKFFRNELNPRGKWLTPFNVISIPIILQRINELKRSSKFFTFVLRRGLDQSLIFHSSFLGVSG